MQDIYFVNLAQQKLLRRIGIGHGSHIDQASESSRFFFFFPTPLTVLPGPLSSEGEAPGILGVPIVCEEGAGVVDERPALADKGVSGTLLS